MENTCRTRDRHVSRVWDRDHWIPHEILTCLHEKHFPVAQSGQKLAKTVPENEKKYVRHMSDSATLSHTETHSATLWVLTYSSMSLGVLTLVFKRCLQHKRFLSR